MAETATREDPYRAYNFIVEIDSVAVAGFSEVGGLSGDGDVVEYREGTDVPLTVRKMPGLRKFSNVTLKRGIVKSDNDFFKWLATIKLNTVERRDLTISLLNEEHEPVMVWKVQRAFPVKVEGPQLKASGNEVAIETIELAHEGLEVQND